MCIFIYILDQEFSAYEVDVWAMGVCLFCFLYGKLPFWTDNITEIFDEIQTRELTIPAGCSESLRQLLNGMLEKDPKERMPLASIKENAWLTDDATFAMKNVTEVIRREDMTEKDLKEAITRTKGLFFVRLKL